MTKQNRPFVSVIMPVHNAGKFLAPAIDSILKQTYTHFELLIVDDRSTDDSWSIIKHYKQNYPKLIRIFRTPVKTNSAGNGATNFALPKAKGSLIARMDADDISMPTRIEKQVEYFLNNPRTIICGTQAKTIDAKGKITGNKNMPLSHESIYNAYGILHPMIHPSVMIRRSLLPNPDKIYEMKWDINDDYYTFFKLLQFGMFANLPEYLLKYRIHGHNLSLTNPKQKFFNSVKIRLEAISKLNYAISLKSFLVMLAQILVISVIPEKIIVPLYMTLRGMKQDTKKRELKVSLFGRPYSFVASRI